jgi:hypothetical protein
MDERQVQIPRKQKAEAEQLGDIKFQQDSRHLEKRGPGPVRQPRGLTISTIEESKPQNSSKLTMEAKAPPPVAPPVPRPRFLEELVPDSSWFPPRFEER